MTKPLTTDDLIDLCKRGVVPVDEWHNRDSSGAQKQLGEALALLQAGAAWRSARDPKDSETTIWVRISYPGFSHFEEFDPRDDSPTSRYEDDLFYIPTANRLEQSAGRDWY